MLSDLYVKHAVANVEHELSNTDQARQTCVSTPIVPGFQLEINAMPELEAQKRSYFEGLNGVLLLII